MAQYFLQVKAHAPKNSAHKAAQAYIMQYNNCLMDHRSFEDFKKDAKNEVSRINRESRRCIDLDLRMYTFRKEYVQEIAIEDVFYLTITKVERFEISEMNQ